jgi:hypothetical protein
MAAAIQMDYLVIDSNGFAQVGDPDYLTKAKIELRILLEFLPANYPVPDEFAPKAYYYIKTFNHDFGTYHEVVVIFDDLYLSTLEGSELESENELFEKFWNWFNSVESVDLESENLTGQIRQAYQKTLDTEKGDHLKVIRVA